MTGKINSNLDVYKKRGRKIGWCLEKVTPQAAYRMPILETLVELGGSAKTCYVLAEVYRKMENQLKDRDNEKLRSGEKRWKRQAQWERNKLKNMGYLKKNSPIGIWEISEAGRKFCFDNKSG